MFAPLCGLFAICASIPRHLYNNVGFYPIGFVQNIKSVVGQLQHWSPKTWPSLDPKTLTLVAQYRSPDLGLWSTKICTVPRLPQLRKICPAWPVLFSLLVLPSNLQFRCMKYLVFLAIYKIFLYPLGVQKFSDLFWSGLFSA